MTNDPRLIAEELERRRIAREAGGEAEEPPFRVASPYPSREELHALCAAQNANLKRSDVEWIVDGTGLALVGRMDAARARTARIEEAREAARLEWMRRNGHPVTPPAPHWTDERHED